MEGAGHLGEPAGSGVSTLLLAWSEGDHSALEKLAPIVYNELHRLASRFMKLEKAGDTPPATAPVNEAHHRLMDYARKRFQDRDQFFVASAQAMRRILVE